MSRIAESATCSTTSDFRGSEERSRVDGPAPRRASAGSECVVIQAGATPKTTPVASESRKAKPSTDSEGVGLMGTIVRSAKGQQQNGARAGKSHDQPGHAAQDREQDALREHLSDQPAARRAQGHADGRL